MSSCRLLVVPLFFFESVECLSLSAFAKDEREGIEASVFLLARHSSRAAPRAPRSILVRSRCALTELTAPDYFERETDWKQSRVLEYNYR